MMLQTFTLLKCRSLCACLALLLVLASARAQSPTYFASGNFSNPNNWNQGSAAFMASSFGTSRIHTTTANGTGDRYFRFYSATSGGTTYEPNGGSDILVSLSTATSLQVTGSGKAYYINCPNTSDNYVFKTDGSGTPGSTRMIVYRIQGTIRSVANASDVTRSPSSTIYPGQSVTISAVANGSLSTGQGVYLRYTTDNFNTSTIVEMGLSSGTTYTTTLGATINTPGTTVRYYVFTSGSGQSINHANADFCTINGQTNSGNNYSYTVASAYTSNGNGSWSTAGTWLDNAIPLANQPVVINHDVTLDVPTYTTYSLSIANGKTLALGTNTLNVAPASGSGTLAGGSSTAASITASGAGGLVVSTNTVNQSGLLNIPNSNIQSAFNIGGTCTVSASCTLTVSSSGSVTGGNMAYANTTNTFLQINKTGTFTRGNELGNSNTPAGLLVTAGTYNMGSSALSMTLNAVTISSGATWDLGTGTGTLNIGALTWSGALSNGGAGLTVNYFDAITANTGSTYTNSASKSFNLTGSNSRSLTGTGFPNNLNSINLNASGATVTISSAISVSTLTLTAGTLTPTALTLSSGGTITRVAGTLTTAPTFGGTVNVAYGNPSPVSPGPELPTLAANIASIAINSGSTVNWGANTTINTGALFSVSGTLNLSTFTISGAGTLSVTATGVVNLTPGTSGIFGNIACGYAATNGATLNVGNGTVLVGTSSLTLSNTTVVINSATPIACTQNLTCRALTISSGVTLNHSAGDITLSNSSATTTWTRTGTYAASGTARVVFTGAASHTVSGGTTWQNLQLGASVGLPTGCSINNQLEIVANGAITGNSPSYASGSTLVYNANTTYNASLEFDQTSGPGYPHHIDIKSGTLSIAGATNKYRKCAGNLSFSGGALTMTGASTALEISGNLTQAGNITLGSSVGGDLYVGGNLTLDNAYTFTPNGREILLNGTNPAINSVSGLATYTLPYIAFNGSGTLTVNANLTVSLRLRLTAGIIDPNGKLTLGTGSFVLRENGALASTPIITTDLDITYSNSNAITSGPEIPTDQTKLDDITITNSNTLTLGQSLTLGSGAVVTLTSGTFNTGTYSIGGSGGFVMNGGTLQLINSNGLSSAISSTTRTFNGGTINYQAGSAQNVGPITGLSAMAVTVSNNTALTQNGALTIRTLTIGSGSSYALSGNTLTLTISTSTTTLSNSGTFNQTTGKVVFAGSSSALHTLSGTLVFNDVDITPTGLCGVTFSTASTVNGVLTMNAGSYMVTTVPTYGSNSTLKYNTTGTYNISIEWASPANVQASNNTLVNIGGSIPSVARTMSGNLIIDAGSAISMNESGSKMTASFNVGGNITANGGLYLSDQVGGDLAVGGDLLINTGSLFVPNSRAITFNGTGNQSFGGTMSGAQTLQFVTINKAGGTLTLARGITLDNGSSSAQLQLLAGTLNMAGMPFSLGGSGTKTFRVTGGTLVTGGSVISHPGLVYNNGTTNGKLAGTINYSGLAAENIAASTYNNLILSGSGAKSLQANTTIEGNLNLEDQVTLNTGTYTVTYTSASAKLTYNNNVYMDAGAEWPATNGPVNVEISNPLGITLAANRTVAGTLTMAEGELNNPGYTLTVGTSASSIGNVVVTGDARLTGSLRRWISTTTSTYQFPVGKTAVQRLATVTFTSAPSSGGTLTAVYYNLVPVTTGLPLMQGGIQVNNLGRNGYWQIETGDGLVPGTYDLTLKGDQFLGVNDYSKLVLLKRASSGSPWTLSGGHVTTTGSNANPIASRTGLTSFSQFGIGGNYAENPLPVSLVSFKAKRSGFTDVLSWVTEQESNNLGFELAESDNGNEFTTIRFIHGQGDKATIHQYQYKVALDDNKATRYYRLQQKDKDGSIGGTWYAQTSYQYGADLKASVWPNPATKDSRLELPFKPNETVTVELFDASGKLLASHQGPTLIASEQMTTAIHQLRAGTYWLRVATLDLVLPVVKVQVSE